MDNPEILNTSLELALEWGKNWLQPIQSRLAKQFPHLSQQELDNYNHLAQEIMHYGWAIIKDMNFIDDPNASAAFKSKVLERYPSINQDNLSRLFSQGCYYALK